MTREQGGTASLMGRAWDKTRERVSNAAVSGCILIATGFAPDSKGNAR